MKRTGNRFRVWWILGLFLPLVSFGQDVVFFANVDKNPVAVGDMFSLKITLENGRGEIEPPDLRDFQVVFGPSRSSSYRIVNGQQSSSITLAYTMRPVKTGTFTIGPAMTKVDGKIIKTDPIKVEVVQGSNSSASSGNSGGSQAPAQGQDQNLFISTQVSRKSAFKGEQIIASYILYSLYNNIELGNIDFPVTDGFWTENIKSDRTSWEPNLEIINGVAYRKAILRQQVLFPQRSGDLVIEPATLTATVNRSFFNQGREVKISSKAVKIQVKSLPGGAPESFKGAVGELSFKASAEPLELKANEAINFKVTVSGRGNLTLVEAPDFKFPDDFESYDPEQNDRISITANGVSGSRSFEYLVIPRYPGTYTVPEIRFTYFDIKSEKYITETAGPWEFKVTGDASLGTTDGALRPRNRVEASGLDIRYIQTDVDDLKARKSHFFLTPIFWLGALGPFILFLAFLVYRKRQQALDRDVTSRKRRLANSMARRRLKEAERALKQNDSKLFYSEIFKALYGYLSDKLGIEPGKLSKPLIRERLEKHGVGQETITELNAVIETCEMARFAPVSEGSDRDFYIRGVQLIEKLEDQLK